MAAATPSRSSASSRVTTSSNAVFSIENVRSKVVRVAMPSANVSARSLVTRAGPRHERANASRLPRLHADDARLRSQAFANDGATCGAASPTNWHEDEVDALDCVEYFGRIGRDSCNELRLVGVVDVPPTFARGEVLDPLARLVEVATLLEDLGTEGAYSRHLVRVRPNGHDDATADAVELTGKRQRLAVVPGAGRNDAALAFTIVELAHQIQAASNLEGACRIVVLVLHQHAATNPLVEQRVVQQRRRSQVRVDPRLRSDDVCVGRRLHPPIIAATRPAIALPT